MRCDYVDWTLRLGWTLLPSCVQPQAQLAQADWKLLQRNSQAEAALATVDWPECDHACLSGQLGVLSSAVAASPKPHLAAVMLPGLALQK